MRILRSQEPETKQHVRGFMLDCGLFTDGERDKACQGQQEEEGHPSLHLNQRKTSPGH